MAYCALFLVGRLAHTWAYLGERPMARRNAYTLGFAAVLAMGVHAAVALVASRGKHLSWIVFLSIGSLVWFKGVDVLIATPGRLLDHFERGKLILSDVKVMVVDEADLHRANEMARSAPNPVSFTGSAGLAGLSRVHEEIGLDANENVGILWSGASRGRGG